VAADASGHGLTGAYSGTLTYGIHGVTGDSNDGVDLDGTGVVDVSGLAPGAFSGGFSLEAWVDTSGQQKERGIVARWQPGEGGVRLWIDEGGQYGLVAGREQTTYLRTSEVPSGWWDHLVATGDDTTLRLYRNGTLIGSEPFSGELGEPAVNLTVGSYPGAAAPLNADLDEVAVYDRALSAKELRRRMAEPVGPGADPEQLAEARRGRQGQAAGGRGGLPPGAVPRARGRDLPAGLRRVA